MCGVYVWGKYVVVCMYSVCVKGTLLLESYSEVQADAVKEN
jgi:hypothetical protein